MMVGRRLGLLVLACVAGCGGAAAAGPATETGGETEAASSDTPETAAPADEAPADDSASTAPEEGASASAAGSEGGSEATTALEGDDLKTVIQLVLKDPELIDHLHIKKPGRAPLKVAGAGLPAKLAVVVGAHDVKVVDEPKSAKDPVLVFNKLERTGDEARVHYRFDVEGLKGRATLYRKNGHWELAANRVIEK